MWSWLVQNREWLFSGAGISIIAVVLWFLRRLGQKDKTAGTPASSSVSNSVVQPQLNINVSPTISPVISPTISSTQSNARVGHGVQHPGTQLGPDVNPVNFKAVFAEGMGPAGKNCFVVSFRNDGSPDATGIMASIGYIGRSGERMLVDYGAWIEHKPRIDIHRGHTGNLIVAVTDDDGKNFAVTDIAPATNYTMFKVEEVGEITPGEWKMIIRLNADNFTREYPFILAVTRDGRMLGVPSDGREAPQEQKDDAILPNVGCLRPELTTVTCNEESDVWSKGTGEGFAAAVVPFSNEPRRSKKTAAVHGLRARLTYYKQDGIEEFKRVDSGCWLGEAYRYADLEVGAIMYLIAALRMDRHAGVVANPRSSVARYSEDHTVVDSLPDGNYELKVDLTAGDHGEYAETYWFRLEVGEPLKIRRLSQRPAGMS